MSEIIQFIVDSVAYLGYWGIVLLMAVESSFVPFPSEVVMIPAGYLAFKGEMNFGIVVLCGIAGSLIGAFVNYYLALYIGRPFLEKWGHYFLVDQAKLDKVDSFFEKHGPFSTFSGRLVPVVRQLISIPAGVSRMNIALFGIYTALGAGIWMVVLTALGYFMGQNEALIKEYKLAIMASILVFLMVSTFFYIRRHKRKQQAPAE